MEHVEEKTKEKIGAKEIEKKIVDVPIKTEKSETIIDDIKKKASKKTVESINDIDEKIPKKTATKNIHKKSIEDKASEDNDITVKCADSLDDILLLMQIKNISEGSEYLKLMQEQIHTIDYGKLFASTKMYEHKTYDFYSSYSSYSTYQEHDEDDTSVETISQENVNAIIQEKIMEDIMGFSSGSVDYRTKEAFEIYKLFNSTWIELKYSMGIS